MDHWAPTVRYSHDGVGQMVNDLSTVVTTTGDLFRPSSSSTVAIAHATPDDVWTDAYVEVRAVSFTGASTRIGGVLRFVDASNYYRVYMDTNTGGYAMAKTATGTATTIASGAVTLGSTPWTMRFEVEGDNLRCFFRGVLVGSAQDTSLTDPGFAVLYLYTTAAQTAAQVSRFEAGPLRSAYTAAVETNTPPAARGRLR